MKMSLSLHGNELVGGTHFHVNGFAETRFDPEAKRELGNGLFKKCQYGHEF